MEYQMDVWERPLQEPSVNVNHSTMSNRETSVHKPHKPIHFGSSNEDLDEPSRQPLFSDGPAWTPPPPPPTFPVSRRDENHRRGNYGYKLEFIFACIAFGFNIETVWKLPYLCVKHGGAVFIAAYFIVMLIIAFPMLLLEMTIGQFHSAGYLSAWNMCPLAKGISFGILMLVIIACVYEHLFTTYHLIYAFFSVAWWGDLQWIGCHHWWNSKQCIDVFSFAASNSSIAQYRENSSSSPSYLVPIPATKEFFEFLQPPLVFAMLTAWGVVILLTFLGAKEIGKLAYVLMPTPVLLLIPLIAQGAIDNPAAVDGIMACLYPDLNKALTFQFWQDAFHIVIWTFMSGSGVILSIASHNRFRNNCITDALTVTFVTFILHVISVLCFAMFFGYLVVVVKQGSGVEQIRAAVTQGVEFSFVSMPDALASLEWAPIWCLVFFAFMYNMGICRSVFYVQAISVSLMDAFRLPHSWVFAILFFVPVSVICFLLGLPLTTQAGFYIAQALEEYTFKIPFFIALFSLPVLVIWVYGSIPKLRILKFPQEIRSMTGSFSGCGQILFMIVWAVFIPLVTGFWVLFYIGYLDIEKMPVWLALVFILIGIVPIILCVIIVIIYQLCQFRNSHSYFTEMFWKAAQPSADWGPATEKHRLELGYRSTTEDIVRTEPRERRPLQTNRFAAAAATPPHAQPPYGRNQPSPVGTYPPRGIGPHPTYEATPGSMATYPSNAPTPSKMMADHDDPYDRSGYDSATNDRSTYATAERNRPTYATTDRSTYATTDRSTYTSPDRPTYATVDRSAYDTATVDRATYASTTPLNRSNYATTERSIYGTANRADRDRSTYTPASRDLYSSDRHMFSSDTQVPNYDEIMIQPSPHDTSTLTYSSHETQL
ncbi:sodium- and chloride-dependent glycine transporter 1-like [Amphiura filiformis]|uniref:sodium- and chloride-dependent glycine transporter 1-like n=1 Tax=Amphiura filiformis TaxID=82378 RepID=UPI003B216705